MENATKALLMAGGVLISIIIITLLVKTYGNIGAFQKEQISIEEAERIEAFNKEYTKYEGQYVYGTEVITVINRSANDESSVEVNIEFAEDYTYNKTIYQNGKKTTKKVTVKSGKDIELKTAEEKYSFINDESTSFGSSTTDSEGNVEVTGLKSKAFKCTGIEYDQRTGKVNSISFEEKMYNGGSVTM